MFSVPPIQSDPVQSGGDIPLPIRGMVLTDMEVDRHQPTPIITPHTGLPLIMETTDRCNHHHRIMVDRIQSPMHIRGPLNMKDPVHHILVHPPHPIIALISSTLRRGADVVMRM